MHPLLQNLPDICIPYCNSSDAAGNIIIGCGLANNADLLLLDEPVSGIDKENYEKIYELILLLKEEGKTVIQIEHNHDFVESLSDTVWFLHVGKAIPFKDYQLFIADQTVIREYLNWAFLMC